MTALSFQRPHGLQGLVWRSDWPGLSSCSSLRSFAEDSKLLQALVYSFLEGEGPCLRPMLVMKVKGTESRAQAMTRTAGRPCPSPSLSPKLCSAPRGAPWQVAFTGLSMSCRRRLGPLQPGQRAWHKELQQLCWLGGGLAHVLGPRGSPWAPSLCGAVGMQRR